jgi:hypothetical protein
MCGLITPKEAALNSTMLARAFDLSFDEGSVAFNRIAPKTNPSSLSDPRRSAPAGSAKPFFYDICAII